VYKTEKKKGDCVALQDHYNKCVFSPVGINGGDYYKQKQQVVENHFRVLSCNLFLCRCDTTERDSVILNTVWPRARKLRFLPLSWKIAALAEIQHWILCTVSKLFCSTCNSIKHTEKILSSVYDTTLQISILQQRC